MVIDDKVYEAINERAKEFIKKVSEKLLMLDKEEALKLINEYDFYKVLIKDGKLDKELSKLIKEHEKELQNIIKQVKDIGIPLSQPTLKLFDRIVKLDYDYLLGSAKNYADVVKNVIVKGIIAGKDYEVLAKELDGIPLFDYQRRVMINQIFTNSVNIELEQAFKDYKDEVRFKFVGPDDEKTRDVCKNALDNQPDEGLTFDEIQSGALEGIDFYNLGGFNCRHRWEVVV